MMKIYKYITILMIVLLGIFCGRNLGQSMAPDAFLYPTACFGLALIVWGSDYETAFRNDSPGLFEMTDGFLFEMKI